MDLFDRRIEDGLFPDPRPFRLPFVNAHNKDATLRSSLLFFGANLRCHGGWHADRAKNKPQNGISGLLHPLLLPLHFLALLMHRAPACSVAVASVDLGHSSEDAQTREHCNVIVNTHNAANHCTKLPRFPSHHEPSRSSASRRCRRRHRDSNRATQHVSLGSGQGCPRNAGNRHRKGGQFYPHVRTEIPIIITCCTHPILRRVGGALSGFINAVYTYATDTGPKRGAL